MYHVMYTIILCTCTYLLFFPPMISHTICKFLKTENGKIIAYLLPDRGQFKFVYTTLSCFRYVIMQKCWDFQFVIRIMLTLRKLVRSNWWRVHYLAETSLKDGSQSLQKAETLMENSASVSNTSQSMQRQNPLP